MVTEFIWGVCVKQELSVLDWGTVLLIEISIALAFFIISFVPALYSWGRKQDK